VRKLFFEEKQVIDCAVLPQINHLLLVLFVVIKNQNMDLLLRKFI
jgi:hypothetical protein